MSEYAIDGSTIKLRPDGPWDWFGWDGRVTLAVPASLLRVNHKGVAVFADVQRLAANVVGRTYTAKGFGDVPGTVTTCQLTVDRSSLSEKTKIGSQPAVMKSTTGQFTMTCIPSMKAGTPPVPDPCPVKRGRWSIEDVGQKQARSA